METDCVVVDAIGGVEKRTVLNAARGPAYRQHAAPLCLAVTLNKIQCFRVVAKLIYRKIERKIAFLQ